jgi:predicted P-loop ATPase
MPVKDKEQAELFLKGWLVRAYRQAVNPKGKDFNSIVNRWFLILAQNRQDTGKSSFLRWLVPDPMWIKESLPRDKDAVIALSRYMFILDDELGALSRPDEMERIKALISTSKVDVRAPYGKVDLSLHRTASFCGSTNSEGIFPSDDTTRFLVLPLSDGTFNWQAYTEKINKAQLWAQVKELETTNWLHANTGAIVKSRVDTNQQYHTETLEMSAVMNHVEIVEDVSAFILQTGDVAVLLADLSNSYQRLNINKLGQALKKVFGHRQAGYLKGGRRSMGYRVKVKP